LQRLEEKLSQRIINQTARHIDVCGSDRTTPSYLNSAVHEDKLSVARYCRFIPGGPPGNQGRQGCVTSTARLDAVEKRKVLDQFVLFSRD
jgi:hypothetical protein